MTYMGQYASPEGHRLDKLGFQSFEVGGDIDATEQPCDGAVVIEKRTTAGYASEASSAYSLSETDEDARYAVALSPQINWVASADGRVVRVSPRWAEMTGSNPSEALGYRWIEKLHPDDVTATAKAWERSVKTASPIDIEYRLKTCNAGYRWVLSRAIARLDDSAQVVRWYGTLEDVQGRRVAEDALRDSEERFRLAAQAAGLGIWDYNASEDQREWSEDFKAMLGLPIDATPSIDAALSRVVPDDRPKLLALIGAVRAGHSGYRFETMVRIRRADTGDERWMKTAGLRIEAPLGRLQRVLVTVRDVTEERNVEDRIRWTADHDGMTRLPNRAAFVNRLESSIVTASRDNSQVALVVFDVDHLKETNDTLGHDAGDVLIQTLAERLTKIFGTGCTVGRLGGDEFAAILKPTDEDAMVLKTQAALDVLREPFTYEGRIVDCQATAGGSVFPQHGSSATELLKAADIALYAAKSRSRGGVLAFRAIMRADLQRRSSMISVARDAVREDRIVPYYQPKVSLHDNAVCGFEALLRWRHPTLGIQAPGTIAAAFEDLDLATSISERMLSQIVDDMRRWLDNGVEFGRIAVNLSPAEFRHESLVSRVLERLHRARIATSRLELEVTETVFLGRGADSVADALSMFSREGVTIALDDFGTGYASLTHLKAFPVDIIKIDRSFVSSLDTNPNDAAIVDAVIGLGHKLGMEIVAEGVETNFQARYLIERGCEYAQGYLFGRAGPAATIPPMVLQNRALIG
ncbi:putative bifunctional diguanylate cyclase/phosphodiesterase [Sphingomonas sp. STIS6.2]|uniref:putative bifunctional diguanylate cyclase/phosphodiesterase n=1 Tax=Sphingomonas sp. STIS6.2 TaxID=1379700 RepID=UPI0009DD91D2|nr:EAL domain-containing protein [Sphingomonas sp. STIS6.2]